MLSTLTHPSTSRYIIGLLFIGAGVLHFAKPGFFMRIMPSYIPYHAAMVYISGAAELAGGLAILFAPTRYAAAIGLIILLIAVFPANIDMFVQAARHRGAVTLYYWITLARLPLQAVLIYWVYWAGIAH